MDNTGSRAEGHSANARDDRLSALLREWHGIEPSAHFDAIVWRRIRSAAPHAPAAETFTGWLREWLFPRPAWVPALATAIAIIAGTVAGFSWPHARDGVQAAAPLLNSRTLAGSYMAMISRDTP